VPLEVKTTKEKSTFHRNGQLVNQPTDKHYCLSVGV